MSEEVVVEELAVEEKRTQIEAFKGEIAKGDGSLIELAKTTPEGKRLFLATRNIPNPIPGARKLDNGAVLHAVPDQEDSSANNKFYGWIDRDAPMEGVVLIDTYAEGEGRILAVGHMDWYYVGDYANGSGNMHDAAIPQGEHESESRDAWKNYVAFKVDEGYQQQGLGSLMLAASAVILPKIGIKTFRAGALLPPAAKTYQRFGKLYDDLKHPGTKDLPIEDLSESSQVDKTIMNFV